MRVGRLRKGEACSFTLHLAQSARHALCLRSIWELVCDSRLSGEERVPARDFWHSQGPHLLQPHPEIRDRILCATDTKGVDVIVNSLSGNLVQETWALIGDFGRFVEIGKRDLLQNSDLGMRPFDRNVTFSGVDLAAHVWGISMGETFRALLFGGCLCMPSEKARESNLSSTS